MLDPIAMIGVLLTTFAIGVVVAGLGAVWSLSLTARFAELRSREVKIFRAAVGVVLCVPPLVSMSMVAIG